ncbi:HutD family protein [Thioclava sp.]|uniref:HutD/Ves family protein n=1 Tax=Thioclava sp. TaxID=1933450 RepID=UPI003AA7D470
MRKIRRDDLEAQPWKNGGGLTWEIAAFPEGAGFEDMQWRLSMAEVASDGAFSAFAGIDRTLAVLSGAGMVLEFAQGGSIALDTSAPPLSFPGEAAIHARLTDGPILDLNIMTRRGAWAHRVERIATCDPLPDGTIAVVTRNQPVEIGDLVLHPGEVLLFDHPQKLEEVVTRGPVLAIVVRGLE